VYLKVAISAYDYNKYVFNFNFVRFKSVI